MADDKLKLLYLMRLLNDETDRGHSLNAAELGDLMEKRYGLTLNRKTVYTYIGLLQEFGMDIGQQKGSDHGYYLNSREFDLPELKLLVDAVQSSKFITKQKSESLIKKLETLTSRENASQLKRQVFIYNRIKSDNEAVYSNVDSIHAAIRDNLQIRFRYCEWTVRKSLQQKHSGEAYHASPWALTWSDANYYMVAYDAAADRIKHFRVDKMQDIEVLDSPRLGKALFEDFDLAAYAKKTFGMYGGTDARITLECENGLAGVIIDRFGQDVMMIPAGKEHFRVRVTVSVSPQFFGWVTGIGKGMKIIAPEDMKQAYIEYLNTILCDISEKAD